MSLSVPVHEKDQLYHDVLSSVRDKNCSQDVLNFLCFSNASFPYGNGSHMLGEILGYEAKKIRETLGDLQQVTIFPDHDDEPDEPPEEINRPLRLLHPDFEDFLIDKSRSGEFYIDPQRAYNELARLFLLHLPSVYLTTPETSNSTRFLLSRLFVLTCTKITRPSKDLWKDLFELDLEAYFHLIRRPALSLCDSFDQLSRLLAWAENNDDYATYIYGFKRSLYMRFRNFWDIKIGSFMIQCAEGRQASNILVALQHPHFRDASPQAFIHMSRILSNPRGSARKGMLEWEITRDGVWLLGGRMSVNGALLPMLSEYLNDPDRSGDLWNAQERFSTMAKTIATFLTTHAVPQKLKKKGLGQLAPLYHKVKEIKMSVTTPETFLYALRWLPIYLEKVSYSSELAKYLRPDSLLAISQTLPEKIDFDQAITRYRALKNPNSEQDNIDDEVSIPSTRTSTTDGCGNSYASSSTGLSTGGYGFYWIRRAFSQETVHTIRNTDCQENFWVTNNRW